MTPLITVSNLTKDYKLGRTMVSALRGVNFSVNRGEFVVIYGPSGCGKTTLLSLLAGLDQPTAGSVLIRDSDIYKLRPNEMARYRRTKIGMVFQQFNLLPSLTAKDNVALPLILSGVKRREASKRAVDLLDAVGMAKRAKHKPSELSGGQQQRIAIARALSANPGILFIDEPTGNLDVPTGNEIMALLKDINRKWGRTVILVTHNPDYLSYGDRVLSMADGKIVEERTSKKAPPAEQDKFDLPYYSSHCRGQMNFGELLRLARIHFFSNRLRTFLTTLGVALGVGSIVTLVSLGVGLQNITSSQLASLDALVTINVSLNKNAANKLDDAMVGRLKKIESVEMVSPSINVPAGKLTLDKSTAQVFAMGINPDALSLEQVTLTAGKGFQANGEFVVTKAVAKNFDVEDSNSLIGREVAAEVVVMPEEDLLDLSKYHNINISGKIVGVSSEEIISAVYMPLSELKAATSIDSYNSVSVKADDRKNVERVRDEIEKMGLNTRSVVDLINKVDRVFLITQIILGIIGGVALLVALIGIINIMTISLLERTHEVGIMKAIGATNKDIKRIFEYEVVLYGLLGAMLGVAGSMFFGALINSIIRYLMQVSEMAGSLQIFSTPTFFAVEMILLTVFVSLLAGLYPAKRAGRLSPMEALRYE